MKTIATFATIAIATLGLAACSPGFHVNAGYGVTLRNGDVITQALGHPAATVSADGSLRIGQHAVTLTPAQQASLKTYYAESLAIVADGKATGEAGAQLGHSVGGLIEGIFTGHASSAGKAMTDRADSVSAAAQKLCTDIQQIQRMQRAIAAQVPAFQPYANADTAHCRITTTTTTSTTVSNAAPSPMNGTTSTSIASATAAPPGQTATTNNGRQP